ncbi:MAG: hypothetical protein R2770_04585 [Acidimicrobiales bacterium]
MADTMIPPFIPSLGDVAEWVRGHSEKGLPAAKPTPAAAFKWVTDEYLLQIELASSRLRVPDGSFRRRLRSELSEAHDMYTDRGWMADPRSFHRDPQGPLQDVESRPARSGPYRYEHIRFTSTYEPWEGEPGADRWMDYRPVRKGHVWMMRHEGEPRPWMVLVNGYRTGSPAIDLASFRARHLFEKLGVNVAAVVLPLHGPRSLGPSGSRVLHAGAMNTVHTLTHGAWDVRHVISWLRSNYEAPAVGLSGISLGGYMVSLVAGLEPGLACVIAGVPESDLVRGFRRQLDPLLPPFYEQWGLSWDSLSDVLQVASPLALDCQVDHDRRFIYAGLLDRWVRPGNVKALWSHWDEPSILWYQGSHLSFPFEKSVTDYIDQAIVTSLTPTA